MNVARATTPTFVLTFTQQTLDLTAAHNVYVTFSQGTRELTKTGADIEVAAKQISVYLDQNDTLQFVEGTLKIQANWTGDNGTRAASEVATVELTEQLLKRVVE